MPCVCVGPFFSFISISFVVCVCVCAVGLVAPLLRIAELSAASECKGKALLALGLCALRGGWRVAAQVPYLCCLS